MTTLDPPDLVLAGLLRKSRGGDQPAFEQLMAHLRPFLEGAVDRQLDASLRRRAQPEDVLQEVWVRAWRKLPTCEFGSVHAFRGWLLAIVSNRIQDIRRYWQVSAKRAQDERSLQEGAGASPSGRELRIGDELASRESSPSQVASRGEDRLCLDAVLARIPARCRELIEWLRFERLSVREIAERLSTTEDAVRKQLQRALEACRAAIHSAPPEEDT